MFALVAMIPLETVALRSKSVALQGKSVALRLLDSGEGMIPQACQASAV
jgi:hypothetical protein